MHDDYIYLFHTFPCVGVSVVLSTAYPGGPGATAQNTLTPFTAPRLNCSKSTTRSSRLAFSAANTRRCELRTSSGVTPRTAWSRSATARTNVRESPRSPPPWPPPSCGGEWRVLVRVRKSNTLWSGGERGTKNYSHRVAACRSTEQAEYARGGTSASLSVPLTNVSMSPISSPLVPWILVPR